MKILGNLILFLGIGLSPSVYGQEDQIFINDGYGLKKSMLSVGLQEDTWGSVKQRFSSGILSNNIFLSGQLGFEVISNGLVVDIFSGASIASGPGDEFISLMSDIHLGLQDRDLNYLGIWYRHLSSGYDIIGLEIRISLSR